MDPRVVHRNVTPRDTGSSVTLISPKLGLNERSLVVVDMQGHHDEQAVNQALLTGPPYIGLVGPPVAGDVCVRVFGESRIVQQGPWLGGSYRWGLDVGKVSPCEIAVGVLAALVRLRAGDELVKGVRPARPEVAEAIDPLCGVTVDVGSARHKVDHEWARTTSAVRDAPGHWRRIPR